VELEAFTFVLLRRGARAADYDEQELEVLQQGHLAFLDEMRDQRSLVLAGPFRDQADETKRGFCVYRTGLEDTLALTERDPAVRAGRIAIEAMTWLTKKGSLG
jgi:uncharacterized protein YciI